MPTAHKTTPILPLFIRSPCTCFAARLQVHHGLGRAVSGTGLGLAISKSLCESMGGTVGCRSTPGVGSTFHFSVLVGVDSCSGTSELDTNSCDTEASTGPCSDSAGSTVAAAGPLARTPSAAAVNARGQASKAPPCPCITQEWNLAVEGSKFSVTTEVLEKRRRKRNTTRRSCCAGGADSGGGGGGGAEVQQDEPWNGQGATAASVLTGTAWGSDNDRNTDDNRSPEKGTHRASGSCSSGGGRIAPGSGTGGSPADVKGDSSSAVATEDDIGAGLAARKGGGAEESQDQRERDWSDGAVSVVAERPRVLVVDDFRMNRVLVCKMLEALDVEVDVAEDGAKAAEACRRSKFSVILMDVIMPVMDGNEAVAAIRGGEGGGTNRATPIIALTASPTLQAPNGGKWGGQGESGFTDLLIKPMTRRTLFAKVAKWASEGEVAWMVDAWSQYTAAQEAAHRKK